MRLVQKYVGEPGDVTPCPYMKDGVFTFCTDGTCPGIVHGSCPFEIGGTLTDEAKPYFIEVMEP